jgi:hypothetical protein
MSDTRDLNDLAPDATTDERSPLGGQTAAIVGFAAIVGAAAGAAAAWFKMKAFVATGDEPPIRVKNGSMELQLLTKAGSRKWDDPDGNPRKWEVSGGSRGKDEFQVTIVVRNGATCSSQAVSGRTVEVEYSDGTRVELKATGKKTRLKSSKDLTRTDEERTLVYTASGHIQKITVDTFTCTFTGPDQLEHVLVLDY